MGTLPNKMQEYLIFKGQKGWYKAREILDAAVLTAVMVCLQVSALKENT